MVADLQIRERTHNKRSLDDAVRAIVAAGGTLEHMWPLGKALAVGDAAVGVPVLSELYGKMGDAPLTVDLDDWWRRLGIKKQRWPPRVRRRRAARRRAPRGRPHRRDKIGGGGADASGSYRLACVCVGCFGSGDEDLSPIEVGARGRLVDRPSASMTAAAMNAPVACVECDATV